MGQCDPTMRNPLVERIGSLGSPLAGAGAVGAAALLPTSQGGRREQARVALGRQPLRGHAEVPRAGFDAKPLHQRGHAARRVGELADIAQHRLHPRVDRRGVDVVQRRDHELLIDAERSRRGRMHAMAVAADVQPRYVGGDELPLGDAKGRGAAQQCLVVVQQRPRGVRKRGEHVPQHRPVRQRPQIGHPLMLLSSLAITRTAWSSYRLSAVRIAPGRPASRPGAFRAGRWSAMTVVDRGRREETLPARLLRGAVGGILAGMVFAAVTMWFADSTGGKANMPLHMISTIVKGDKAMAAGSTSIGVGVAVHLVLSALFGMLFALAVPRFRTNGTVA